MKTSNKKEETIVPSVMSAHCNHCNGAFNVKDLYKLSWRYNDKKKVYIHSGLMLIHTGYSYLCKSCLKDKTKD